LNILGNNFVDPFEFISKLNMFDFGLT
jgi:hypothetical protein